MAKQISKSVTSSSGVKRNKEKSTSIQKNTQKNTQTNNAWSTTNQTGGNTSVTGKDLTGLSPQTLALQQKVLGNTGYTPSQSVQAAGSQKTAAENAYNNIGPYTPTYSEQINQTLNSLLERKPFEYDFNADALYQTYRDSYEQQARQASDNAVAAAAALSGGYGNSYGSSAASQAYEQYMTALNDRIPELYQIAADRYNNETNNMYNLLNAMGTQEDRSYGRYRDDKSDLAGNRDYYNSNYMNLLNQDMTQQQNEYSNAMNLLNYLTSLEAKDVSKSENWSNSEDNSGSTTKSKNTNTTKNTNTSTSTSTSSDSSVTNTTASGKSGTSSGKKSTNKNYNPVKSTFASKVKQATDSETGNYDNAKLSKAFDYLQNAVDKGLISDKEKDEMIDIVTGGIMPKL